MLDRTDFEPVFFAPFVSSVMAVDPAWIDLNGHMNMAYYHVLFDRGIDEMYTLAGFGWDYLKERNHSFFTAEVHLRYLRELNEGDPVRVTFQLLELRFKAAALLPAAFPRHRGLGLRNLRKHVAAHRHGGAESGALPARHCAKRLGEIRTSHGRLPRPEAVGKRIAMPEKA